MELPTIWTIRAPWITSATSLLNTQADGFMIESKILPNGLYRLSGNNTFYYLPEPLTIKALTSQGITWMTDEPRFWYDMCHLAWRARGSVLVGGLGLGLIHHWLKANPAVYSVHTIELHKQVTELVLESNVEVGDFFDYCRNTNQQFDTIITDFALAQPDPALFTIIENEILPRFPNVLHLHYGYQQPIDITDFLLTVTGKAHGTTLHNS